MSDNVTSQLSELDSLKTKAKSWWEKPEGKLGRIGLIVLVGMMVLGVLFKLNDIITWFITLSQNLLHLGLVVVGIFLLLTIVSNKKFRATVFYLFSTLMRFFTGLVIELDKIAILKTYLKIMKENIDKSATSIGALRGQRSHIMKQKAEAEVKMKEEGALAKAAEKLEMFDEVTVHANQVGRIDKTIKTYDGLIERIDGLLGVLQKLHNNTKVVYIDTKNDIEAKEVEYEAIRSASNVIRSAGMILNGDSDRREIYEQALEMMSQEVAAKIGEMEQFFLDTESVMKTIDLQQVANTEIGMDLIKQMDIKLSNSVKVEPKV